MKEKKITYITQQILLHMGSHSRTANSNSNIPVLVRPKNVMLKSIGKEAKKEKVFLYHEVGPDVTVLTTHTPK